MRAMRPDMHVLEVPGSGHCPTLEEPTVVPTLDHFLQEIA
jgi:pimeloyl-ACP methyl ester carboxylesterase